MQGKVLVESEDIRWDSLHSVKALLDQRIMVPSPAIPIAAAVIPPAHSGTAGTAVTFLSVPREPSTGPAARWDLEKSAVWEGAESTSPRGDEDGLISAVQQLYASVAGLHS